MNKLLAIESSCDETAIAIIDIKQKGSKIKVLSHIIASQAKLHQRTHGVVPEVAAREHLKRIGSLVTAGLKEAKTSLSEINYLAVTAGPGLVPSLLVGSEYVKGLAFALGKKVIPVNHMLGHLYSSFIENPRLKLPSINLIVSGGHTYLVLLKDKRHYKVLGKTVDDAAGEAFDKVAKLLSLPYPGGAAISKLALKGKKDYSFPRPMIYTKNFDFSFSGLKTAVLYKTRDELNIKNARTRADVAMSFENAVVDVLVAKTLRAAQKYKAKCITLSGGVAANRKLRKKLEKAAKKIGLKLFVPDYTLCTDNALMIANAAAIMLANGFSPVHYSKVKADPVMEI